MFFQLLWTTSVAGVLTLSVSLLNPASCFVSIVSVNAQCHNIPGLHTENMVEEADGKRHGREEDLALRQRLVLTRRRAAGTLCLEHHSVLMQ